MFSSLPGIWWVSGRVFTFRADAPYGSHPSGRTVLLRPESGISDGRIFFALFLGRTTDGLEERGTEPLPTAAAIGRRSARSLRYLCSTSIARITDQSALTDGLRRAGSRQRFHPMKAKLHSAISESADEPQTLLRDRGIADGHSVLCLISGRKQDETTTRDLLT